MSSEQSRAACPVDLLEAHHPLLLSLVGDLGVGPADLEDAIQGAALGFLEAYARFDVTRKVPIGVYARGFIKKEIRRATGWLRGVPPSVLSLDTIDAEVGLEELAFAAIEVREECAAVRRFVATLDADDQYLYQRLFVDQAQQATVARELGFTPMQLTRRKQAFLAKARRALASISRAA